MTAAALSPRAPHLTSGVAVSAETQDAAQLAPGAPRERELSTGQVHTYRVELRRGDFLRLIVQQKGVDVAAEATGPDGHEVVAVNAMDDEFRPEVIVAIADADGIYTVTIRGSQSGAQGRYAIQLEKPRPLLESDRLQVEAERAFARGRQRRDVNNAATWPEALTDFSTARDHYRALADRAGEMKALIEIAVTQNYQARPEAAEPAQQAERLAREIGDRAAIARVLRVAASIHSLAGDFSAAARAVEDATDLNRAIGNRVAESHSLNYTAMMYASLGDVEKAIALYQEALPIARVTHGGALESAILNNLGVVYSDLGDTQKAVSAYEQALANMRAQGDVRGEFQALANLGYQELALGNQAKARELLFEALAIARRTGDRQREAQALGRIALTQFDAGEYTAALEQSRASLAILQQLGDVTQTAWTLSSVGRALHRLGRAAEAIDALQEALVMQRQTRERFAERDTLSRLAQVERDRGNLDAALRYSQQSVELDEATRAEITSPELRTTFVAAEQNNYELLIDVLQRKHGVDRSGRYDVAALEVGERARARELLDSLLDARVDLREGIEPSLLERERLLQRQLNDASAALSRLSGRTGRDALIVPAAQRLDRLTSDYQLLQAQIRQQSPRYVAVTQPRPIRATEIQESVIDDETVLLEFSLGEERSWLWAVTPRTMTSVELPARREIDRAARSLYELFTARQKRRGETSGDYAKRVALADARLDEEAAAVSGMLLGGIARQLNSEWRTKRLAIVASGALEYLPFAALPAPDPEDSAAETQAARVSGGSARKPLALTHEIVSIPSASVLAVLRREAAGRPRAPRALAIFADPVFEKTDPRVAHSTSPMAPAREVEAASRAVEVADSLYGRNGLSRLPFSREEANAIATLTNAGDTLKAVDFKASREAALSGLSQYRIVHFATHGVLDSERPALSSLILSLVDERGVRRNGYLRLPDIYNLRLDADLVVLSACQTALGKEIRGEGLVGLTRAFFYAGAPRVVASLWEVSDLATTELMKKFYRGMLQQHLPAAAALRSAQVQMSQDPRWASPYFWAGFVLQGEWR